MEGGAGHRSLSWLGPILSMSCGAMKILRIRIRRYDIHFKGSL